jgi:hypothetical protein
VIIQTNPIKTIGGVMEPVRGGAGHDRASSPTLFAKLAIDAVGSEIFCRKFPVITKRFFVEPDAP